MDLEHLVAEPCCTTHDSWATLAQHLAQRFPQVELREVILAVGQARDAIEAMGLARDGDPIALAEVVARQNLFDRVALLPQQAEPEASEQLTS